MTGMCEPAYPPCHVACVLGKLTADADCSVWLLVQPAGMHAEAMNGAFAAQMLLLVSALCSATIGPLLDPSTDVGMHQPYLPG